MAKNVVVIERPNGIVEHVDFTSKIPGAVTHQLVCVIREQNKKAGTGHVFKVIHTETKSNYAQLAKRYNDFMNEGGEGYVPDMTKHPEYRQWEEVTEIF